MRVLAVTSLRAPFVKKQVESLRNLGIEISLLQVDRTGGGRRVYSTLGRNVKQLTAEWRPEMVHVIYGGVTADVVTRSLPGLPAVITFCGTDLVGGNEGHKLLKRMSVRYGVLASRRAATRARAIVLESRRLMSALPATVDPARIWIVPDGIDLELFRPLDRPSCRNELGWDDSAKHVLFPSSRSRPEKRFALAEAAVARLRSDGWSVLLHELDGVRHEAVPTWLNAVDVVLMTSVHEGSPNAIKEALACNVAVVSVDVGDVPERIKGIDGCFLADSTPEDIAAKLGRALTRSARVAARGAVADLELGRTARRLEGVYGAALATGRTDAGTPPAGAPGNAH